MKYMMNPVTVLRLNGALESKSLVFRFEISCKKDLRHFIKSVPVLWLQFAWDNIRDYNIKN